MEKQNRKSIYGIKSIQDLRNDGYSSRAIEDIVTIADKHRARPSKIADILSEGYNVNQVSEIYESARTNKIPVEKIESFYNAFKPDKGQLSEMINEVYSFEENNGLHKGRNVGQSVMTAMNNLANIGKRYSLSLDDTMSFLKRGKAASYKENDFDPETFNESEFFYEDLDRRFRTQ